VTATHLTTLDFGPRMLIERYRLDNGLELLVLEDHVAPVVCYQTWFRVGSRHDPAGKTGIAHLFEHLMFNETEDHPAGDFDRLLEEAGAESNACTYVDWTFYTDQLPRDALELVLDLETERMHRLILREPQLESEREVVMNERRQTVEDDIDGSVGEALYRLAFERHPYRHPTIGSMADIEAITTDDCLSFYRRYYAPNNAVLVVVGDVEAARLAAMVAERYGGLPAATLPVAGEEAEPQQRGERRLRLVKPTPAPRVVYGYHAPEMAHDDHAPLVLLNEILFGGRSSRGYRRLVRELEIATDVSGSVAGCRDPGLYEIGAMARPGGSLTDLGRELDAIILSAVGEPIDAAELERARARVELSTLHGLETVGGRAESIGFAEVVLDDPCATFTRLEAFGRVSLADVTRVAARYLGPERRSVIEVVGEGEA
jgi:zinc protease